MASRPSRATLIYDGACQLCRNCVAWVRRRDARQAFEFVAFQDPGLAIRFPQVPRAVCERAVVLVDPDGSWRSGADALPGLLRELPGWRALAAPLSWRALRPLAAWLYGLIATRRFRDSGTPPRS